MCQKSYERCLVSCKTPPLLKKYSNMWYQFHKFCQCRFLPHFMNAQMGLSGGYNATPFIGSLQKILQTNSGHLGTSDTVSYINNMHSALLTTGVQCFKVTNLKEMLKTKFLEYIIFQSKFS